MTASHEQRLAMLEEMISERRRQYADRRAEPERRAEARRVVIVRELRSATRDVLVQAMGTVVGGAFLALAASAVGIIPRFGPGWPLWVVMALGVAAAVWQLLSPLWRAPYGPRDAAEVAAIRALEAEASKLRDGLQGRGSVGTTLGTNGTHRE